MECREKNKSEFHVLSQVNVVQVPESSKNMIQIAVFQLIQRIVVKDQV